MAKIDLKPLSLSELKALQGRVEKAIERHEKKAKTKALSSLRAQAKALGFSLDDLVGGKTAAAPKAKPAKAKTKAKAKSAPAYRDPKNPDNTYAGRGPRPAWLKAALDGGAKLEDFKV